MNEHWYILGAGAIGGLFAHRLSMGGAHITLLSHRDPVAQRTLKLVNQDTSLEASFPVSVSSGQSQIRHLLVTTKSYDVVTAIATIAHRLSADCIAVVMVNGLGWEQPLRDQHPHLTLFAASTTAGSYRPSTDTLRLSGEGLTQIGPLTTPLNAQDSTFELGAKATPPAWFDSWNSGSPHTVWENNMRAILLRKLAINCAINPLTAAYDVPNGALLSSPYHSEFEQILVEINTLLLAAGEHQISRTFIDDARAVAQTTAGNISSMCADLRAGRRTEIDMILGYLLHILKPLTAASVATPQLDKLLIQLKRYQPNQ